MASSSSDYYPHPPRYPVADSAGLHVEVERLGEISQVLQATLVDMSRNGFCLQVPAPLVREEPIVLRLCHQASGMALTVSATVRWHKKQNEGTWSIGCLAAEQIAWETLGELFLNGILSREAV